MNFPRALFLTSCVVIFFAACATAFRDDSHYVAVSPTDGYYILKNGSPLALKLGYTNPPTSDDESHLHDGNYVDVVAFRFNSAGVLADSPAYFPQDMPDSYALRNMARLRKGVSTWPEVLAIFGNRNWTIKQPGGGTLVYHQIAELK